MTPLARAAWRRSRGYASPAVDVFDEQLPQTGDRFVGELCRVLDVEAGDLEEMDVPQHGVVKLPSEHPRELIVTGNAPDARRSALRASARRGRPFEGVTLRGRSLP